MEAGSPSGWLESDPADWPGLVGLYFTLSPPSQLGLVLSLSAWPWGVPTVVLPSLAAGVTTVLGLSLPARSPVFTLSLLFLTVWLDSDADLSLSLLVAWLGVTGVTAALLDGW